MGAGIKNGIGKSFWTGRRIFVLVALCVFSILVWRIVVWKRSVPKPVPPAATAQCENVYLNGYTDGEKVREKVGQLHWWRDIYTLSQGDATSLSMALDQSFGNKLNTDSCKNYGESTVFTCKEIYVAGFRDGVGNGYKGGEKLGWKLCAISIPTTVQTQQGGFWSQVWKVIKVIFWVIVGGLILLFILREIEARRRNRVIESKKLEEQRLIEQAKAKQAEEERLNEQAKAEQLQKPLLIEQAKAKQAEEERLRAEAEQKKAEAIARNTQEQRSVEGALAHHAAKQMEIEKAKAVQAQRDIEVAKATAIEEDRRVKEAAAKQYEERRLIEQAKAKQAEEERQAEEMRRAAQELERQNKLESYPLLNHAEVFFRRLEELAAPEMKGHREGKLFELHLKIKEALEKNGKVRIERKESVAEDALRLHQVESILDIYSEKIKRVRDDEELDDEEKDDKIAYWKALRDKQVSDIQGS